MIAYFSTSHIQEQCNGIKETFLWILEKQYGIQCLQSYPFISDQGVCQRKLKEESKWIPQWATWFGKDHSLSYISYALLKTIRQW